MENKKLSKNKTAWTKRKLPDSIISPHPDPVGDGPVLLLLLGKLLLNKEGLVRRLNGAI